MKRVLIFSVLFFMLSVQVCRGDIPQTMSYQGYLTNTSGDTVDDGNYSLTFNLYDVATGGSKVWKEIQSVTVVNGIFNVILGSNKSLSIAFDKQYWLGIAVEGSSELRPRIQLTASPYSLNARSVEDGAVTTAKLANGAVTDAKIAAPLSLSGSSINAIISGTNNGNGNGVSGESTDNTGVRGHSTNGTGVSGYSAASNGSGVFGINHGADSYGVTGFTTNGIGVRGMSTHGTGVYGESTASYGVSGMSTNSIGVRGISSASYRSGVYGRNDNAVGYGVTGMSTNGRGVYGYSTTNSGVKGESSGNAPGVLGVNNSSGGWGGWGVYGRCTNGTAVYAEGGFAGTGSKCAEVKLDDGTAVRFFTEESAEVYFTDYGEGRLSSGRTHIELDPVFLQTVTIDAIHPMKVFVQVEGDCRGVYVTNKTSTGFDVVELQRGRSDAPFSYRVVCKRKYYEDARLTTPEEDGGYNRRMMQAAWPERVAEHEAEQARMDAERERRRTMQEQRRIPR